MALIGSSRAIRGLGASRFSTHISASKLSIFGSLISVTVALIFLLGASGCQVPSVSTPISAKASQATLRPRSVAVGAVTQRTIRTEAAYKQAVAAYRAHQFADALRLVDALLTTSHLSAEDKAFLSRQQRLCKVAVSGKSTIDTPIEVVTSGLTQTKRPPTDCGPRALLLLCQAQHVPATLPSLVKVAHTDKDGTSMDGLASAAQSVGFHTEGVQMDKDALTTLSRPAIAWVDGNHYVAVLNVHQNPWTGKTSVTIHDPNKPEQEELSPATLLSRSGGVLLVLSPAKTKKAS